MCPVSRPTSRIVAFALLGVTAIVSLVLLLPVEVSAASAPAACHEDDSMPMPVAPQGTSHDCCLVGHNHALPTHSAISLDLQLAAVIQSVSILALPTTRSLERARPALIDSGPALNSLQLRI